jgi:hypothetical protein
MSPRAGKNWSVSCLGDSAGVYRLRNVTLTPDGKTYAYSYGQCLSDMYVVEGLR